MQGNAQSTVSSRYRCKLGWLHRKVGRRKRRMAEREGFWRKQKKMHTNESLETVYLSIFLLL